MTPEAFEQGEHELTTLGSDDGVYTSDRCQDIDKVDSGIWAFSEKAWDWLPELEAAGCRIASNVKVDGEKRYKLVFPGPVLDLLDIKNSDIGYNESAGAISKVYKHYLYEWDATPPAMFRIWYPGPKKSGSSMDTFVNQDFVDRYNQLDLTGLEFTLMDRTPPPEDAARPFNPILYWPSHAKPFAGV